MKKHYYLLTIFAIAAMLLSGSLAVASNGDNGSDDSSGSSSSSSSDDSRSSSSGSSSSSSSSSSGSSVDDSSSDSVNDDSSGLEVETEHGVTFLKPHGTSSDETARSLGLNSSGMEVETEHGVTFLKPHGSGDDVVLETRLSGRILLQVQERGEAWWVDPVSKARLFLGSPNDAFAVMRGSGLGISNANLELIAKSDEDKPVSILARRLAGRILLQVEEKGEAWYVDPVTFKRHFLGRPADAFRVMRSLGLGITNNDLNQVRLLLGQVGNRRLTIALLTDSNSGQSGIAEIKEVGNKVKVEIRLYGMPVASRQPAHIHLGNRPNLGAIKYPLSEVVNGNSETILDVSFDKLLSERPLGINIHKSAAEMAISVASGNL